MSEVDDILAEATTERRPVVVCIRGDLAGRIRDLEAAISTAVADDDTLAGPAEAVRMAEEIHALEAEAEQFMRTFIVQAVPRFAWRTLMVDHPPTDEQRARGLDHNPDTFPYAAVALCSVTPKLTEADARRLAGAGWDPASGEAPRGLTEGEWHRIWSAVVDLNKAGGELPKSWLATAVTRSSEPSSTTAASEESPTASS